MLGDSEEADAEPAASSVLFLWAAALWPPPVAPLVADRRRAGAVAGAAQAPRASAQPDHRPNAGAAEYVTRANRYLPGSAPACAPRVPPAFSSFNTLRSGLSQQRLDAGATHLCDIVLVFEDRAECVVDHA